MPPSDERYANVIMQAAHVLIGAVRADESGGVAVGKCAELTVQVDLTGGGVETWTIAIECVASSH